MGKFFNYFHIFLEHWWPITRKTVAQNTKSWAVWWLITRMTVAHNTYRVIHKTKVVIHNTTKNAGEAHNTSCQEAVLFGIPVGIVNDVR